MYLSMVPQLSRGWQHNYLNQTRLVGYANEQSMYSLMSVEETKDYIVLKLEVWVHY